MSDTRARMIGGTARMLASRGLQATSFRELVSATGAPRGSIYHHFPGGKDELVTSTLDTVSMTTLARMRALDGQPALQIASAFLSMWRDLLQAGQLQLGCAVLAVAVNDDEGRLRTHAGTIFSDWIGALSSLLRHGGMSRRRSHEFAIWLIASVEGAVVMSRAIGSLEPFEVIASAALARAKELSA